MKKAVLTAESILIAIGILLTGHALFTGLNDAPIFQTVARTETLIAYAFIAFYIFRDYKRPHGNTLKWLYFTFALTLYIEPLGAGISGNGTVVWSYIPMTVAAILISFLSGELNHPTRNIAFSAVIMALLVFSAVYWVSNGIGFYNASPAVKTVGLISRFNHSIEFAALTTAYLFRYKEHKNA